jgi:sigma54-dependent transcription regulator
LLLTAPAVFAIRSLLLDTLTMLQSVAATSNDHNIDISFLLGVRQFALEKIYRIHLENVLAVCIEVCVLLNQGVRRFPATTRCFHIP